MIEDALSNKTREFMIVLDQVKKYRAILSSLTDFTIILATTLATILFMMLLARLNVIFLTNNFLTGFAVSFVGSIVVPILGVALGIVWVARKVRSVKVGKWKTTLAEGAPGAIKLLQELEWDKIYSEIRYAKLGFGLYGLARTSAVWIVAFLGTWFGGSYLTSAFHLNFSIYIALLVSLAIALAVSMSDFKKKYDQIGRLDALLWELRWFDNEFRRNPFQA